MVHAEWLNGRWVLRVSPVLGNVTQALLRYAKWLEGDEVQQLSQRHQATAQSHYSMLYICRTSVQSYSGQDTTQLLEVDAVNNDVVCCVQGSQAQLWRQRHHPCAGSQHRSDSVHH